MLITGIDKLHLVAKEWQGSGKVRWSETIQKTWQDVPNVQTGEVTQEEVTRVKKYINDKSSGLRIDNDGSGLLVVFNPNRLLTKTHHVVRHPSEIEEAVGIARTICNGYGIDTDFNASTLSQVDLCRQAEMAYPIEAYQPAFTRLQGSRLETVSYEKGYYFKNDNITSVFYDKAYQANKVYKVRGLPENLQRFEMRFKNARTIKSQLKCSNLEGLRMVDIDAFYNQFALKRIFNGEKQLTIFPHAETLAQYVAGYTRDGVIKFLSDLVTFNTGCTSMIDAVNQHFGSLKALRQACMGLGFSRQRWKKTVEAIKGRDRFYQKTFLSNKVTPVDLIDELKEKYSLTA